MFYWDRNGRTRHCLQALKGIKASLQSWFCSRWRVFVAFVVLLERKPRCRRLKFPAWIPCLLDEVMESSATQLKESAAEGAIRSPPVRGRVEGLVEKQVRLNESFGSLQETCVILWNFPRRDGNLQSLVRFSSHSISQAKLVPAHVHRTWCTKRNSKLNPEISSSYLTDL